METPEHAPIFGGEYIRTNDFEGVIFPKGLGIRDFPQIPNWKPSPEVVLAAETRLAAYLSGTSLSQEEPQIDRKWKYAVPLILHKLSKYRRQYSGIFYDGRPALYINFFIGEFDDWPDWATSPVDVDDGGHNFFQVIYRPQERDFVSFWVNGEA